MPLPPSKAHTPSETRHSSAPKTNPLHPPTRRQRETEARTTILAQILTPSAADRLGRIRLVKESRANDVESRLIALAQSGQLRQKVTEEQLKDILGAVAEQSGQEKEKIVVVRRKGGWEDDEEDDLLDL